jgi:phosphoenolpyruvate carboxykinase (GTP)
VFMGATMASETTAAATGEVGRLRHDPFAMLPFVGYNMADYFAHWIAMGERLGRNAPPIFSVNWFRTDADGRFIWPGFSENARVIEWIVRRLEGDVAERRTPIGGLPLAHEFNLDGIDLDLDALRAIIDLDPDAWRREVAEIAEYFDTFDVARFPIELRRELDRLRRDLGAAVVPR